MGNLSFKEKITIQLMRNKQDSLSSRTQADIANKFGLSRIYIRTIIKEIQHGKKLMCGEKSLMSMQA